MRPELLAPAGSYEALRAAIDAGADAVYIGGNRFGARAYADNLDEVSMCKAIDEVHLRGRKIYMTVNTLLKQEELERDLFAYLKPYYEQGLDAVIVQDYGVLRCIRRWFPDLHIHCSTQMTITGPLGARFLESQGVARIVTARELSLQEISSIHRNTSLEIESFVHGALCYCYSGQCLFSSMIGGRSGNRGRCAQPCRLPYQVFGQGRVLNGKSDAYVLSPKDMCTVELLPEILQAGVTSLKIEGRMKKPEYTAGVVSIYRKYLDLLLEDPGSYRVEAGDLQALAALYNRDGFNKSYYQVRNGRSMMALRNKKSESRQAVREGQMREKIYDQVKSWLETRQYKEKIKGSFTIYSDVPAILTLYAGDDMVTVEKEGVQRAKNQPLSAERMERQLKKTGDSPFVFDSLDIFCGDDCFVPMQFLNEIRREAIGKLADTRLERYRRTAQSFGDMKEEPICGRENAAAKERVRFAASVETREQLAALLSVEEIDTYYLGYEIFEPRLFGRQAPEMARQLIRLGKKVCLSLPHAVREGELLRVENALDSLVEAGVTGFLVRNLESFGILKKHGLEHLSVLDYSMYTMNRQSRSFWEKQGILMDTVPFELNEREISRRGALGSEMVVYGYIPMMVTAQCLKKNLEKCTKSHELLTMRDRYGKDFPVKCCCNSCYNVVYNSVPLALWKESEQIRSLGLRSLRLSFTIEDGALARQTAESFVGRYVYGENVTFGGEYTRGHFRRGVE